MRRDAFMEVSSVRFEERELKPYAEPIVESQLKEGEIYFSVIFLDDEMLIPVMEPRVYIGRKQDSSGDGKLYFQDIESYRRGIRYGSAEGDEEATFQTGAGRFMFEYERALDVLLACSLRRRKTHGIS